jgi:predicted SnoaL-like aldol condensation-catalyzing enzyme
LRDNRTVDATAAARRWAETWERAWPTLGAEAIVALYADEASYRALAFREPDHGLAGVRRYLAENFGAETEVECRFGEPIAAGDRAAVEWWASWIEAGRTLTLAGTTVLRFDTDGKVVDHRDYWNETDGREPPYDGWG